MNEPTYSRAPIATTYFLDAWHLGGVRLFRRMDEAAAYEWNRLARRVEIPAKQPVPLPEGASGWVVALESGRVRLALPAPEPEPEPEPVLRGPKPNGPVTARTTEEAKRPPTQPPPPPQKPASPLVLIAEPGDLFGNFSAIRRRTDLGRTVDTLRVEALSDAVLWLVPQDAFRGFLWRWGVEWRLPAPVALRWDQKRAGIARRPFSAALRAVTRVEKRLPFPRLPIATLWGMTRNARAASAFLQLLARGHEPYRGELRLRGRFWVGQFARAIGVDEPWARMWLRYVRAEGILRERWSRWGVLDQWRLQRWVDVPMMAQTFKEPPDPYADEIEPEIRLGRASRNADGTTPQPDSAAPPMRYTSPSG